jgi:hypothetical protein
LRPGLHAVRVTRKHRNDAQPSQPIGSLNLLPRATIVGATVTFLSLCATFPS